MVKKIEIISKITLTISIAICLLIGGYLFFSSLISDRSGLESNIESIIMHETNDKVPEQTYEPFNSKIINITENSFSVFFRTKGRVPAYIQVGKNKVLNTKVLDGRDTDEENLGSYHNHFFTYTNPAAELESIYVFRIVSDDYVFDNQGELYSVTLSPLLDSPPGITSIEGKNYIKGDSEYTDTILFFSGYGPDGVVSSTTVGSRLTEEDFIIGVGTMRNSKMTQYFSIKNLKGDLYIDEKHYQTQTPLDFGEDSVYNLKSN